MALDSLEKLLPVVSRLVKDKPNVVGFGIGYKRLAGKKTDQLAFLIFVTRKLDVAAHESIPVSIEGVPTDVIESGPFAPTSNRDKYRPIPAGVQIMSKGSGGSGTLGCYLVNEAYAGLFMLSNNHVLARYGNVRAGTPVSQGSADQVAKLFRYPMLGDFSDVDCAVAQMTNTGADGGSKDALPVLLDYLGSPKAVAAWVGDETADVAISYGRITPTSTLPDQVVFHIDAPAGANAGYLRVLEAGGAASAVEPIGGWFGEDTQAAGIAVVNLDSDSVPDVVIFFIDRAQGGNRGVVRVGHALGTNAKCIAWDDPFVIDGWWGTQTAGGGIATADLDGNGKTDLITFFIDAPAGENQGYLRVGRDFNIATGTASWADPPIPLPGAWGAETQGGDITYLGKDPGGRHLFLLMQIDNPPGENCIWYRTVALSPAGMLVSIDGPHRAAGWVGSESQGLGVGAVARASGSEVTIATVDAPSGANSISLRTTFQVPGTALRLGARLSQAKSAALGDHVWKSGKTTEVLDGEIIAVSASIKSKGTAGLIADYWTVQNVVVEPVFTDFGDSGSVYVEGQGNVVALHHSGASSSNSKHSAGSRIDRVLERLRLSSPYTIGGWIGAESFGGSIASVMWPKRTDLVVVHVDHSSGGGVGYYRVGFGVDTNGQVTGATPWSAPSLIQGWKPQASQSVGVAVAKLPGSNAPCLVVLRVDHLPGKNDAWLHIGRGLGLDGLVAGGWTTASIPWPDGDCQGVDVALADLNGNGRPDLIVLNVSNPAGENSGMYRVGRDLSANGQVTGWGDWLDVHGWWGAETAGAGIAVVNLDADSRPEIVVFHVDNAASQNMGYYRIGWNVDDNGRATNWSSPVPFGDWWGTETQGAGLTVAEITGNSRPEFIAMHIDNPVGENTAYYRVLYDIMPNGMPATWSVAT